MRLKIFKGIILCILFTLVNVGLCMAAEGAVKPAIFPQPQFCELSTTDYSPLIKISNKMYNAHRVQNSIFCKIPARI